MGEAAKRYTVYEDLFELPDNIVGEILNGVLETHPRPAPRHARASSSLGGKIVSPYDHGQGGPGGWWILFEPELHLDVDIMVPDLAGWQRERMPELPETAWFGCAPDWVCEVLSPSTGKTDRAVKMPLYAHYGVEYLWLVDPDLQILEAYQLQTESSSGNKWVLLKTLRDDQSVSLPPFTEISFDLSVLWA
ncbi:MAG: Uma2 family endonuclease [Candidatus Electrothrix sp. AW2]|nr:Uma2 family endonuclease [Candidatus Electrothrix gigas]MCI5133647.1 Uma2 family endonuclease [Candidatus Electrothrix gigas]MCI5179484.1 Uma2 family endonuclease [Candidatus Electrothrix gigas]